MEETVSSFMPLLSSPFLSIMYICKDDVNLCQDSWQNFSSTYIDIFKACNNVIKGAKDKRRVALITTSFANNKYHDISFMRYK